MYYEQYVKMITLVISFIYLFIFNQWTFPPCVSRNQTQGLSGKCSPTEVHLQPIGFVFKTI